MSAGSTDARSVLGALVALACVATGCNAQGADRPPPPSRHEIAPAPPGARGAHAAGTQPEGGKPGAPAEPGAGELEWGDPLTPAPESAPDAGTDAGEVAAPEGVPL